MQDLAPIVMFVYCRFAETKRTVESLQANHLSGESDIYIFSDGAKSKKDEAKVEEVRTYLKGITGFKKVVINESNSNLGLANSVIGGVSNMFKQFDKLIVMEDDLVSSQNFLDFMNQALTFYENNSKVISLSGYTNDLKELNKMDTDFYYSERISSWGWGTWKSKWDNIDWEVSDYDQYNTDNKLKRKFHKVSNDLPTMLKRQMNGEIDSWAVRWCFHQFMHNLYTVYPTKTKILNIGDGEDATHSYKMSGVNAELDSSDQREFLFDEEVLVNFQLLKQFRAKFSFKTKIKRKLKSLFE